MAVRLVGVVAELAGAGFAEGACTFTLLPS